jgi:uncharacterized protein YbaP (TraB family)
VRLISLILILAFAAGPALAQPPLWVAHGRHATLYLFGSVHILPRDVDWAPAALTSAIAKADEIWFELPIDEATDLEAARLVAQRGIAPAGDDLFSHLSEAQATRLTATCQALAVSCASLARMRPWLADLTLSLAMDAKAGAVSDQGVEQKLQALAPPSARRMAFETAGLQIGLLADTPLGDQLASLNESLTDYQDDPDSYRRMIDEWMTGDLAGLRRDALTPLADAAPGFYRRLITERNQRWAGILAKRLEGRGVGVVVVGAGHLIGPAGVPALLRARGFRVEGPE